jgi:DNA-binding response OmpR family regulator
MKRTIAVFNPSPVELLLYKAILESRNYMVFACNSDWINLDALEKLNPSVVIVDGIRGWYTDDFSIIEQLHAHPALRTVPILLLSTSMDGLEETNRLSPFRPICCLMKPFAAHTLLEHVRNLERAQVS